MSLGWDLGLLAVYVLIMPVKTDVLKCSFICVSSWHLFLEARSSPSPAFSFLFFLLLAWVASTVGWTCFPMAVKPPDGTLPTSHKLEQERCTRHWNSLRFRFIGITINSVRWGGSLHTDEMQIRLCCFYFSFKTAMRDLLKAAGGVLHLEVSPISAISHMQIL